MKEEKLSWDPQGEGEYTITLKVKDISYKGA